VETYYAETLIPDFPNGLLGTTAYGGIRPLIKITSTG
jgi:hypothetical protein